MIWVSFTNDNSAYANYIFLSLLVPWGFVVVVLFLILSFFCNHKIHRENTGVSWSTLQYLGFPATTL